jgi:hypothetical protein
MPGSNELVVRREQREYGEWHSLLLLDEYPFLDRIVDRIHDWILDLRDRPDLSCRRRADGWLVGDD